MPKYQPTIGLEIHAILKTRTKMFCDSLNDPEEKEPNKNTCPVCLGHPGTLPTINKRAVEAVIRVGLALGGKIAEVSKFDRKNYFYPDLPKGYQISQYDLPLVLGGELNGVRIRRIHLEEDTGRLLHDESGTLIDFNRAGAPLMELVTEPDIKSAEQAVAFARELQRILRYLDVSEADMEKGQLRVEANVSLQAETPNSESQILGLGTKVELKNINSFKAVGAAIAYEIERQRSILESGGEVKQETRGWDEAKQKTVAQRSKEEAHDYRYFPEPDLPPFEPRAVFDLEDLKRHLPELPQAKRERLVKEFGLSPAKADFLVDDKRLADFFEAAVSELKAMAEPHETSDKEPAHLLYNYLTSDLLGLLGQRKIAFAEAKVKPEHMAHLAHLIREGKIGSRQAKDILAKMVESGEDPEAIMRAEGLETVSDLEEIERAVREVIAENEKAAEDYRRGKEASLEFLVGQTMKRLRGRGNPEQIRGILTKLLK
jgi:aspartyl-tRNA(Asn)/glutamyl-tRNA(Gln) amidotransferase subunit B